MLDHGNIIFKLFYFIRIKKKKIIILFRYVTKENFEKYGIEYPKNEEIKVPKSTKSTVTKITNFLKSQVQTNSILVEK